MYGEEYDDRHPDEASADVVATVLGSLTGTFAVLSMAYLAVLGFAGGTVPVMGWNLPGGFAHGLLWMAVLSTAGVVVLGVLPILASMALYRALSRVATPTPVRISRPAVRQHARTKAA